MTGSDKLTAVSVFLLKAFPKTTSGFFRLQSLSGYTANWQHYKILMWQIVINREKPLPLHTMLCNLTCTAAEIHLDYVKQESTLSVCYTLSEQTYTTMIIFTHSIFSLHHSATAWETRIYHSSSTMNRFPTVTLTQKSNSDTFFIKTAYSLSLESFS